MQKSHSDTPKIDLNKFYQNLAEGAALYSKILAEYAGKMPLKQFSDTDPLNITPAIFNAYQDIAKDPEKFMSSGVKLYNDMMNLWLDSAKSFLNGKQNNASAERRDKRFSDDAWNENPFFKFIKDSYLKYADWVLSLLNNVEGLDKKNQEKLIFFTKQFLDAVSPSNNVFTNPEVLRATLETNAENLVKGLKRLAEDISRGNISQTDLNAFKLGENLATTPGKVVFQNDLLQLIQYEPSTKEVYKTPLLFIPAWINKYYIADLRPNNSFVKWLVGHGYTVFMVSWVNPTEKHKDKDFSDYMKEGVISAIDAISKITGVKEVNTIGYCLGGTLLATTLSYLSAKGKNPIKSATFLTTLLDFKDAGDLSVFIDEEQVSFLEKRMSEQGYLDGKEMAMTFSMLRANDLIWSFVVNNYLLGKDPFPFDLLYWNSDSTRMPAKMHSFYLRNMYLNNNLAHKKIKIDNVVIDLSKIETPAYFLSTLKDHIAPWQATYAGAKLFKNAVFTLADSGHIAGVVNPPEMAKYPHWVNEKMPEKPEQWQKTAKEVGGSWWVDWSEWSRKFSGAKIPARKIAKALEDAPGSYVKER